MLNSEIKKRLIKDLDKLPFELQKRVQEFAHALVCSEPQGGKVDNILHFSGRLKKGEADQIRKTIDADCERLDNEW